VSRTTRPPDDRAPDTRTHVSDEGGCGGDPERGSQGLIAVGRGQRELILRDRQTGKTAIAIDAILNQRDQNMLCVYCAIAQRASTVAKAVAALQEKGSYGIHRRCRDRGQRAAGSGQFPPTACSSRSDSVGALHGKISRQSVDEVLRPYISALVAGPDLLISYLASVVASALNSEDIRCGFIIFLNHQLRRVTERPPR